MTDDAHIRILRVAQGIGALSFDFPDLVLDKLHALVLTQEAADQPRGEGRAVPGAGLLEPFREVLLNRQAEQLGEIDTIGLEASAALFDFNARGVDEQAFDPLGGQVAVESEAFAASLITADNQSVRRQIKSLLGQADLMFQSRQISGVDASSSTQFPAPVIEF